MHSTRFWIFAATLALTSGCGGEPAPGLGNSDPTTDARPHEDLEPLPTGPVELPSGSSARCAAIGGLSAGIHRRTLQHDGLDREYDVYIPRWIAAGEAAPLVFYLHPLLTNKRYLQGVGVQQLADREGFVAVFPQGIDKSWNGGACCGPSNGAGDKPAVDDVGFIRAVFADVGKLTCVDRRRVYATGFSNGGFLAHRLACEASDLFAAVAPVSAVNGIEPTRCTPRRPVAVLAINGRADPLVPYEGGFSFEGITDGELASAERTMAAWAKRNGCRAAASSMRSRGALVCKTFDRCAGGVQVTLCSIEGAGHCWFGEAQCAFGPNSSTIDATQATWDFLRQYRR